MQIIIDDSVALKDIQEQFSTHFPYLKIEFFRAMHGNSEASPKKEMLDRNLTLAETRTIHNAGTMTIHADQTVAEIEAEFQVAFGLPVQVFRKAGTNWIETTTTDHRTLKEQNRWAKMQTETEVPDRHMKLSTED